MEVISYKVQNHYNHQMENNTQIIINQHNGEELLMFAELLAKSPNEIINEALEFYFETQRKKILE